MKAALPKLLFLLFIAITQAQVGVGTTDPNASLDIRSTNQANPTNTDGILIPKVDEFPTINPTIVQDGMMVYVTGDGSESRGFYYWNWTLTNWINIAGARVINDLEDANSDGSSVFLGVNAGANDDSSDNRNVSIGYETLSSNTSGSENLAVGYQALLNNDTGNFNLAIGSQSLLNNTTGYYNTGIGRWALHNNISGVGNKALGTSALYNNINGNGNLAFGGSALLNNVNGGNNIAFGVLALGDNISGGSNTAIGQAALRESIGYGNVALGYYAGYFETGSYKLYIENTDADSNNALIYGEFGTDNTTSGNVLRTNSEFQIGNPSLTGYAFPTNDGTMHQLLQTDGNGALSWVDNTSIGVQGINDLIDGSTDVSGSSIFLGINAGSNDDGTNNLNIGIGFNSLTANVSGVNNTAIGSGSMQDNSIGSNNVSIGSFALPNNTAGSFNTCLGSFSLAQSTIGIANTALGSNAQRGLNGGSFNTSVGQGSLYKNVSGIRNIAIGYQAGYNEIGNNKLYIESSSSATPLIYGEFDNDILGLNGNVAIGHQAPNAKLHALEEGTSGVQTIVGILESNTSNRPTLLFSEAANPDINDGMSIEYNGTGAGLANRLVLNAIGGAPLFEFRNGGSLTLTQGDLILANDGASDREIIFQDDAGNNDRVLIRQNATDDIYFGDLDDNNGNVILRAGGTDEIIIEDGGQVGINTMTPNYDLEVNGDAAKPGGGTWIASSDRRLKQNIRFYQRGLEDILKIDPVTFNYNSKAGFDKNKTHVGVIAQDLQQHIPEMVLTTDSPEAYLAVDNSAMTYILINAIKEQQKEIEKLKKEIELIKSLIKTD